MSSTEHGPSGSGEPSRRSYPDGSAPTELTEPTERAGGMADAPPSPAEPSDAPTQAGMPVRASSEGRAEPPAPAAPRSPGGLSPVAIAVLA
ncbi:MAG TPA: hypothetical protein VK992_07035, partial [Candidatus Caenarcaniphilales bacterium]|nr:hypothetical protein [Candidatus Caenarcaniphilales bacterium]